VILFRCDYRVVGMSADDVKRRLYVAGTLRAAREFAMSFLQPRDGEGWVVTINRCATNPNLYGGALLRAALNGEEWMAKGSLFEIERWWSYNGSPQTMPKPKGKR